MFLQRLDETDRIKQNKNTMFIRVLRQLKFISQFIFSAKTDFLYFLY